MAERRSSPPAKTPQRKTHRHHTSLNFSPNRQLSPPDSRPIPPVTTELCTTIKVAARIRPKNPFEEVLSTQQLDQSKPDAVQCTSATTLVYGDSKELVTLDCVFPPHASQREVFNSVGLPMVEDVLRGYNGTIFSYGQTGAGKTFSMMGTNIYDEERKGIVPRAAEELFARAEGLDPDVEFAVKCSMVEIYKERLRDLLTTDDVPLQIKEDPRRGIFVSGLKQIAVASDSELLEVIDLGEQMRTVASTQWNAVSSRSHQLIMLEVKQAFPNDTEKRGILNLVDLAGSERVTYYGVTGNKLQETKKINWSLSALGNVIHALTSSAEHIPYRDSKLTRLLQESLGGNFKTVVLVALSPSYRFLDESINSIKFAQRAKHIKNPVHINVKESVETYIATIAKLRQELADAYREISVLRSERGKSLSPMTDAGNQSAGSPFAICLRPCDDESKEMQSSQTEMRLEESLSPEGDSLGLSCLMSKTRSLLDRSTTVLHSEELLRLTALYEEQLKDKSAQVAKLQGEVETLKTRLTEADQQLQSAVGKLAKAELRAHEALEEAMKKKQENLELNEQVEFLRSKSASSSPLIKELRQQLASLEAKCSELTHLSSTASEPTNLEFVDYQELEVCPSDPHPFPFVAVRQPLTALGTNKYAEKLQSALASNSYLSQEMATFTLNSGLLAAALINCSLSATVHSLTWKTNLWRQKHELSKLRQVHLQNTVKGLESIIDTLYDSFRHVKARVDRLETEPKKRPAASDGKSLIMRQVVRARERRGNESAAAEKSLQSDRPRTVMSFAEGESLMETASHRQRSYEVALNLQQSYNQQLKQSLEESQREAYQYLKLVQSVEKGVAQDQKHERKVWMRCIAHLREVYEKELVRKHAEVVRLHEELGLWAQRVADCQGAGLAGDLMDNVKRWSSSGPLVHSKGLQDALRRADSVQRRLTLQTPAGDTPPQTDFDNPF